MFKVLVIAYYFPPLGLSGVQRVLKFTKYMKKFNWEPTVITTGNIAYFAHDFQMLKEAEDAGVRIIRTEAYDINSLLGAKYKTMTIPKEFIRKTLSSISKTIFIPDNKKSWSKKAYTLAKDILSKEKFDMIFVTIPPFSSFTQAAKLKKEFDLPLFVDYRDLWFGNHFAFYPTPYHRYKHKKLEYEALKAADKVIVINRKIKEKLLTTYKFLTFEDVVILPQGFDPEEFTDQTSTIPKSNKMKLTYSGIFYETITPEFFLRAFKKLSLERPDIAAGIELEFVGLLRKENKKLVTALGLNDYVRDAGYMDHIESINRLKSADVLWMMIGHSQNADTVSTGKLFEYFGTRKPVIGCVPANGAAAMALKEYVASYITEPDNIEGIKNAIITAYEQFKAGNLPVPNVEFIAKHDRIELTEQLTTMFQFYLREE